MAKKKAAYVARRFLDNLAPGDPVPDGQYEDEHLERMLQDGKIARADANVPVQVKAKAGNE